jgi:hypothetical protein
VQIGITADLINCVSGIALLREIARPPFDLRHGIAIHVDGPER